MFEDFDKNNKNDDFLNEYRQKLSVDTANNFEERKAELNRSKNVFVGAVSGVALAAVVGWFILAPKYQTTTDVELPTIKRPQTAIKIQPTEPGGMEILNQDKTVYDILEKKSNPEEKTVENILPPPEVPQLPAIAAQEEIVINNNPTVDKIIATAEEIIQVNEAPATVAVKEVEVVEQVKPISQAMKEAPIMEEKIDIKIKIEEPKAPAPTPAPVVAEAAPKQALKEIPVGVWQVQLISSPNKKAVESSKTSLTKKYKVLEGEVFEIETADLGSKGTFYRLKAGAYQAKADADKLCNDLKALGASCIVKKK